jgi:hypothetical protein
MRRILTWALWLLLIVAVIGAGIAVWRYLSNDAPPAGEQVIISCSQECADRAQCGTTTGEQEVRVVLGGKNSPTVEANGHDVFFLHGTSVEIKERMEVTLKDADGEEFTHTFDRVEFRNAIGDIAETGWIPEWCIERP